jgi:hypothetical protein
MAKVILFTPRKLDEYSNDHCIQISKKKRVEIAFLRGNIVVSASQLPRYGYP